jgi:hypothetical protein
MGLNIHVYISLIHIFLIVPALLAVAFFRSENPDWVYNSLVATGLVVMLYHGYKAFISLARQTGRAWLYLIHALLFAPLMLYIGINQKNTPRAAYEMLAMIGFAGLGYHLWSILTELNLG